jgi:hypothetical protein
MATTDARTGFRLPWSSEQRPLNEEPSGDNDAGTTETGPATETSSMTEGTEITATADASGRGRSGGSRGPSKFMADLTKAMQAAAESARAESIARLQTEAKTAVEQIHARSATEANDLRRQADDDVAAIREWSKQEIARIREETDERIAGRKHRLESDIEEHGGLIERQIERVQSQVGGFEAEMADFFERLLGEEDPTRFASLAENLPEPPMLDVTQSSWDLRDPSMVRPPEPLPVASAPRPRSGPRQADDSESGMVDDDAEVAMARIEASARDAAWHDERNGSVPASDDYSAGFVADRPNEATPETVSDREPVLEAADADPRLAALAMSPDFATAEAEAAAAAGSAPAGEEIPTIADDALAARLAGLVGAQADEPAPRSAEPTSTQVVVTGLVSVASIASFKRHLGRLPGVQGVGVSSGPDGEFVFAVRHTADVILRDAIPSLPAFQARVTAADPGTIQVTARDPESEA